MRSPIDLVHLWFHESSRVYSDKFMEENDIEHYNKVLIDTAKRHFEVCLECDFDHETFLSEACFSSME